MTRSHDRTEGRPADAAETRLDALFAEAREAAPAPLPEALAARLLGDALAAQPQPAPRRTLRPGLFARLRAALAEIGGAPSLAGVGVAGMAGIWIGFASPGSTGDWLDAIWTPDTTSTTAGWAVDDETLLEVTGGTLLSLIDGETP